MSSPKLISDPNELPPRGVYRLRYTNGIGQDLFIRVVILDHGYYVRYFVTEMDAMLHPVWEPNSDDEIESGHWYFNTPHGLEKLVTRHHEVWLLSDDSDHIPC